MTSAPKSHKVRVDSHYIPSTQHTLEGFAARLKRAAKLAQANRTEAAQKVTRLTPKRKQGGGAGIKFAAVLVMLSAAGLYLAVPILFWQTQVKIDPLEMIALALIFVCLLIGSMCWLAWLIDQKADAVVQDCAGGLMTPPEREEDCKKVHRLPAISEPRLKALPGGKR